MLGDFVEEFLNIDARDSGRIWSFLILMLEVAEEFGGVTLCRNLINKTNCCLCTMMLLHTVVFVFLAI